MYPFGERSSEFLVATKQSIVSISGRLSPHNFGLFFISHNKIILFVVVFPTTPLNTPLYRFFSIVVEVVILLSVLFFPTT